MTGRSATAAATRRRVLDAASGLMRERLRSDIRVQDVAMGAAVSEMTVLRLFGTKAALLKAAMEHARQGIVAQRSEAEPGDVAGSIAVLFDHYEELGDLVIRNLAEEGSDPAIGQIVRAGRDDHRQWIERQFGPRLGDLAHPDRSVVINGLIAACDVYVWKLLRRDLGLNLTEALETVQQLVEGLIDAHPPNPL